MQLRKSFGVTGRSVSTPGVKDRLDDIEGEIQLEKDGGGSISCEYDARTVISQMTDLRYKLNAEI